MFLLNSENFENIAFVFLELFKKSIGDGHNVYSHLINFKQCNFRGRRQMNRLNFGYLAELAEFKKNI